MRWAIILTLAMLGTSANATPSGHIQHILAHGDGASRETAFKASSVRDEHDVAAALGLQIDSQSLVIGKHPYDMLEVSDPKTGAKRELWFDISSFYPEF
ncbi:DUF4919 domain-containing protein [Sphingomonas oryzagri]|jgi:hypothetical protein|uniref:DUF4919 domain-containing protein n=1 Tax=Sphingomonas oryzagri TaxID=3042314 RepID=A0ABT6MWR7_9SPHN|nr:DUF4919 domain-containing protein [Sphingomonas oryzagri]MDH7637196.1 DUF4919 domain-containing protein [Sphingomonas oryzagri]